MNQLKAELQALLGQLDGYAPPDFNNPSPIEIEKLQLYRIMANQIPQRIFWKDLEYKYVWANKHFADDCGVEFPEILVGQTDFDMPWTKEQAEAYRADDTRVMETGEPRINIIEPQTRKDGSHAWLNTNKIPVRNKNGEVIGIVGTYEDITERTQAEIALRRYQQMLELVFSHIPVAVFWKDRELNYLGCNANFANDAGLESPDEIMGKSDYDLPWTNEQAESYRQDDLNVIETGEAKLNYIEEQQQATGKNAWIQVNKAPLRDADNKVMGVLGTYQYITEQIEAREALRRARLATYEERQRLARELHDAVSQTLWTASLMADLLPTVWENDQEEGMKNLDQLKRLTKGALAEMRMLLLELRPASLVETDLHELLDRLAEATMSRKKLEILVHAETIGELNSDAKIGLYRIAQEGLNNIARHSRATQATIELKERDQIIELIISDDGRGFDVSNMVSDRMGLSIMQERAAGIHAEIKIDSEIGAGTKLTIHYDRRNNGRSNGK
ncbi:MAG: PAS domain-containing protein [Chloroflexota bacterium]